MEKYSNEEADCSGYYMEGFHAFNHNYNMDYCPYRIDDSSEYDFYMEWKSGWIAARKKHESLRDNI